MHRAGAVAPALFFWGCDKLMNEITAIRPRKGRGKRVNIFLDGKFAFSLEAEVAVKEGLRVGKELSSSQAEVLARSDCFQRCLNVAIHFLGYRPRSESEIRERLQRRGFDNGSIEAVVTRLRERGLVDDVSFAQFWKENRDSFSPRSQRLTKLELKQKGVASDIIDQVVSAVDDNENAYQAALSRGRNLPRAEYQDFRRRLGGYLKRRGFSYEVIKHAVERVWREPEAGIDSL